MFAHAYCDQLGHIVRTTEFLANEDGACLDIYSLERIPGSVNPTHYEKTGTLTDLERSKFVTRYESSSGDADWFHKTDDEISLPDEDYDTMSLYQESVGHIVNIVEELRNKFPDSLSPIGKNSRSVSSRTFSDTSILSAILCESENEYSSENDIDFLELIGIRDPPERCRSPLSSSKSGFTEQCTSLGNDKFSNVSPNPKRNLSKHGKEEKVRRSRRHVHDISGSKESASSHSNGISNISRQKTSFPDCHSTRHYIGPITRSMTKRCNERYGRVEVVLQYKLREDGCNCES